jgi:transposase IS116/IS110/IS902 family protein
VVVRDDSGQPVLKVENPTFEFVRRNGISVLRNRMTGQGVPGWSVHPDERVVLSGDVAVLVKDDGHTHVLDARTLTTVRETSLFSGGLVRLRRTHPGGGVETTGAGPVVASADGRVVVATRQNFDNHGDIALAVAGSPEVVVDVADERVRSLALTADGDLLLTAATRQVRLWHVPTGNLVTEIECTEVVDSVEISADGCAALAVIGFVHIQCWELDWDYRPRVWSHAGRCRDDAAFAMLAGSAPIPASSGKTVRHRLNRSGDRQLNRAVYTIVLTRLRIDPATRAYAERRRTQGKTAREIRRCLGRYVARQLYTRRNGSGEARAAPRTGHHRLDHV